MNAARGHLWYRHVCPHQSLRIGPCDGLGTLSLNAVSIDPPVVPVLGHAACEAVHLTVLFRSQGSCSVCTLATLSGKLSSKRETHHHSLDMTLDSADALEIAIVSSSPVSPKGCPRHCSQRVSIVGEAEAMGAFAVHQAIPKSVSQCPEELKSARRTLNFRGVEASDHCETPLAAYLHIQPLLALVARRLSVQDARLAVYDPYFCAGAVKRHLGQLGFDSVYNEPEDFYERIAQKSVPQFDVLVTNPPFSHDHIQRAHSFAVQCGRPWFMLVPQHTARKPFFMEWLRTGAVLQADQFPELGIDSKPVADPKTAAIVEPKSRSTCSACVFVGPTSSAYDFAAPASVEEVAKLRATDTSDHGRLQKTSSQQSFSVGAGFFQCVWFVHLGSGLHEEVVAAIRGNATGDIAQALDGTRASGATIALETRNLPNFAPVKRPTPAERRWKRKQQKQKQKQQKQQQQQEQKQQQIGGKPKPAPGDKSVTSPARQKKRFKAHLAS